MKVIIGAGIVSLIVVMCGGMWVKSRIPKVGYVQSHELIFQYKGMAEAQKSFSQLTEVLTLNSDTLVNRYQRNLYKFYEGKDSFTSQERDSLKNVLETHRENIVKYKDISEERLATEEKEMLDGVSNQINAVIQDYGSEEGFDLIFGSGTSGILLYGDEAVDVTDEILDRSNSEYLKREKSLSNE